MVNNVISGMEITNSNDDLTKKIFYNKDILFHITEQLCKNRFSSYIRKDIKALSDTNSFFYDYYSAEKNKQTIIRIVSHCGWDISSYEESIAHLLCCHTITKKINHFCKIASFRQEKFTQEDFKEIWYFNARSWTGKSLLYMVIENNDFEKAQLIINNLGVHLDYERVLSRIAESIYWKKLRSDKSKEELDKLCSIYQELQKIILMRK
jgi:hypothetical protein